MMSKWLYFTESVSVERHRKISQQFFFSTRFIWLCNQSSLYRSPVKFCMADTWSRLYNNSVIALLFLNTEHSYCFPNSQLLWFSCWHPCPLVRYIWWLSCIFMVSVWILKWMWIHSGVAFIVPHSSVNSESVHWNYFWINSITRSLGINSG